MEAYISDITKHVSDITTRINTINSIYRYDWSDDVGVYTLSIKKDGEDVYYLSLEQDTIRDKLYELSTTYEILDSYTEITKTINTLSLNKLKIIFSYLKIKLLYLK